MENLTHSLSKKSYSGNGFGMTSHHKSVYDDVFGGPPKFGVPTLAPRFEDYSEIFGGFHSSRGSSIPILDLPVVEEVELAFDVRSSRLDYSEVFGGFNDLDFAVSFEDLVRKSNGADDSSDDAWSPAQSECLLDETDPSACSERSQSLLNADADLFDDARQFNVSYHKVNQKTSEKVSNRAAHIAQVHAIPGHAYLMNDTHASTVVEDEGPQLQASGDLKSNSELLGRRLDERCFKKSVSFPANRAPGSDPQLVGSSISAITGKKPFVTVNDISLRTRPSRLPPPSRPPPVFAVEKGEPQKSNSKLRASNSYAFERMSGENSPPFYDVEIDASSSKVASTAVKVAMEKAQTKITSAKELMEKQEVPQGHIKLQAQDTDKIVEEKINMPFNGDNCCEDDKVQCVFSRGGNGMQPSVHEGQNVIEISQEASDLLDDEKYIDLVEKPTNRRHGKESSSHVSHKAEGTFSWSRETEFFEVVETDISLEVVEQDKDDKSTVLQNKEGPEDHKHGMKTAAGASQQQEVIKEVRASKEAPKLEEKGNQLEMWEGASKLGKNGGRSNKPIEPMENPKNVKVDVTSYGSEMSNKKIKRPKQYPQKDADKDVKMPATVEHNVAEVKVKDNPNGICERNDPVKVIINVPTKKAEERRARNCIVTTECDKNLEEAVEQMDDVKQEIQLEERKKQEETCKKEENKKKEKEVRHGKNSGSIVKETIEQEEYEKRLNMAVGRDESENDLKRTFEQEDKERHKKTDFDTEEKKETVLETQKSVQHEQHGIACETGELDASLTEVGKQEPGKHGATFILEDDDTEEKSSLTSALKGSTDTSQYALEHEELAEQTEDVDQIKWDIGGDEDDKVVNIGQGIHAFTEGDIISSSNGMLKVSNEVLETSEATQAAISCGEDKKLKTKFEMDEQELDTGTPIILTEEMSISSGKNQSDSQHGNDKVQVEGDTKLPFTHELTKDSDGANIGIGNSANKQVKKTSQLACDPEKVRVDTHDEKGQSGKVNNAFQMTFSDESRKEKSTMHQVFTERTENGKKIGAALFTVLDDKKSTLNTHLRGTNQNVGPKQRQVNVALAPEDREIEERLHQEKELEKEQLRKLEEEKEREREREKDRMAVDRATLEVRERSYAEARDRAERTVFGWSTTEVRQRAAVEARGRLDKEPVESRLRAERAAVERATAEARQRAFEKAMADKASFEARVERSFPDKFYASSRNAEMRQSSSSDLPVLQSQGAGTSNMMRSSYSKTNAGVESESPQRSKARLERYRRTAERAAKALAEKNMRDLLAQREQAERRRLAENLDAEVRRWSSGKEGNLRALLSTLQYILGPDSGWQPVPLTEVITSAAVKKAYRKATLCVHPDKLQQRGASIQQKYVCEKVFDLLKEAWNTFNSEER